MALQEIESKDKIDINSHFKIVAGPGAGKTTFLINHIKNIIENSNKVNIYRKIACITYTNVAIENIIKRLDYSLEVIEVATIHSFLYKHVLKPYLWVLQEENKFNLKEIKGHDKITPTRSMIDEFLQKSEQKNYLSLDNENFKNISYILSEKLMWKLKSDLSVELELVSNKIKVKDKSNELINLKKD